MGQQQALLLPLATLIVGLAIVAGIAAFDQGQRRSTRDALSQRALEIGGDILSAHREPNQLGGIDLNDEDLKEDEIGTAIGLKTKQNGAYIDAEGAGKSGTCDIDHDDGDEGIAWVDCGSEEGGGVTGGFPAGYVVKVRVDPDREEKVEVIDAGENVDHTSNN